MNRRQFLYGTSATATFLGTGISLTPTPTPAEVVITLQAVSAAFNLASGISGFLSRGSNPTIPILISLANAVDALNIRIDEIDRKLDLMLTELFDIRRLVEKLPYETQMLSLGIEMREPYATFLELQPETQQEPPSEAYLRAIPEIRDRMRTNRIKYLDLAKQERAPAFEAVLQLALAQDAELILAAEMQRPEMHALGLQEDIKFTLNALKAYSKFFDAAVDPGAPGSITAVKALLAQDIGERLGKSITFAGAIPTDAWVGTTEYRSRTIRDIFETRRAAMMCVDDGTPLCLDYTPACAEPSYARYFNTQINVNRVAIPQTVTEVTDPLNYPYLHEVFSNLQCDNIGKGIILNLERSARDINDDVTSYYKVHYAHGVCALAQAINLRQQRILRDLIGI